MTERNREILEIPTEADMLALGGRLAPGLAGGQVVYLSGELGVGKTTLARGILRGLDFDGRVKSPSYGLVESYPLARFTVHHLDLYRLTGPGELEFIGLEDLVGPDSVLVVEWPERGAGRLPAPTGEIRIRASGSMRFVRLSSPSGLFDALKTDATAPPGSAGT